MNFLLRPENSFTFPWIPLDILQILICFHSRQFLYEYVFPWIPLHRSFQFLLLPMTKKRTLGKVQIERYLDSFPYTSLSLRCCCSRCCRLVGARVPIPPKNFGESFNPISTRRGRLCPPHYYWHPLEYKTFLRPCAAGSTKKKKVPFPSHGKNYYMVHTSA